MGGQALSMLGGAVGICDGAGTRDKRLSRAKDASKLSSLFCQKNGRP